MNREPLTTGQIAEYCHVTYRAVLKWIAQGKLKAYRTPGKHSRVKVEDFLAFLNQYQMPTPQELKESEQRIRILIADDDSAIVNLIAAMLREEHIFDIRTAQDGFITGQLYGQFQPHLIVLDINMPGIDGYDVCRYIRQNLKDKRVKILTMTGMPDPDIKNQILNLGADDHISKPFDLKEVKGKIVKLLSIKKAAVNANEEKYNN